MPNSCIAPFCKANREKLTKFCAPRDEIQRLVWQRAIPRKGFVLKPTHYVCEKHFLEDDILRKKVHKDQFGNIIGVGVYARPKLKPDAVPRLFPGCPAYLSKRVAVKRKSPEERQQIMKVRRIQAEDQRRNKTEELSRIKAEKLRTIKAKHLSEHVHETDIVAKQDDRPSVAPVVAHCETGSQNVCVAELSLFTWLLSDTSFVVVPESWYRVIPVRDNVSVKKFIVYTSAVGRQVDGNLKPIYYKEVCVSEDCEVSFAVLGRPVKLPGISDVLSSFKDLSNTLALADKAKVCKGALLPNINMEIEPGRCRVDVLGLWRHLECPMIIDTGFQCKNCRNVKLTVRQK